VIWPDAPVNRQRRVLVCVAVGAGLALTATVINRLLANNPEGGWFMYSPSTEPVFSPAASDGELIRAAVIWLTAIGFGSDSRGGCSDGARTEYLATRHSTPSASRRSRTR
jgi:hypothetical protein